MCQKSARNLVIALLVTLQVVAFGASRKRVAPPPPAPITPLVTFGDSAVPLVGPWKFFPGDSPWSGDSPLWAQPGFDDSTWTAIDLTPKTDPFGLDTGSNNFVLGWTAAGFPNLTGYAWYRLRVRVADPAERLSLKMPANVDNAYQVYANGQFAGQFGDFDTSPPTIYLSRPVIIPLPASDSNGEIELALRFYMSPSTPLNAPDAGGMHHPPVLGLPFTLGLVQSVQDTNTADSRFGFLLTSLLFLLLAPGALAAWLYDRHERAFLWLSIQLSITVLWMALSWFALTTFQISGDAATFWLYAILYPVWLPGWIMVWWHWFGSSQKRWIPRAAWSMAAANLFIEVCALAPLGDLNPLSLGFRQSLNHLSLLLVIATCVLLVYVLFEGYRSDNTEGAMAAAPVLLLVIAALFNYFSPLLGIPYPGLHLFGLTIDAASLSSILLGLVIGAAAMRRFVRVHVTQELERQVVEHDIAQSSDLQQYVLSPEEIQSPDFNVEVQYCPAQVVGGDFYQTLLGSDGSLLVIIGDISGKGIPSALLVSILVGAARARANDSFDPASMLGVLNQRLFGHSSGNFATCLVAELRPDGRLRVANAGHIAPYLNGAEMPLAGSLPLGLADKLEPALQTVQLRPGDQLTFITDGIAEARNSDGELFGFDRLRIICNEPIEKIVARAQQFGQDDDITVVRVVYTAGRREMFMREISQPLARSR